MDVSDLEAPQRRTLLIASAALSVVATTGCATGPTLSDSWRDPEFKGPPLRKVLVVGVSRSDTQRRIFEDTFTQGLVSMGSNGVVSYQLLPETGALPDGRIQQAAAQAGADGLLTARVLRVEQRISVIPGQPMPMRGGAGFGRGFNSWYGSAWATTPSDIRQYEVVTIESTLWDLRNDRVIWTGTSQTTQTSNIERLSEQLAKLLVGQMKNDGVL
jgi:hypothetical protein